MGKVLSRSPSRLASLLLMLRGARRHISEKDATRNKVCYELFYLGLIIGTEERSVYRDGRGEGQGKALWLEMRWRLGRVKATRTHNGPIQCGSAFQGLPCAHLRQWKDGLFPLGDTEVSGQS